MKSFIANHFLNMKSFIDNHLYRYERACAILYTRISDRGDLDNSTKLLFKALAASEGYHASILGNFTEKRKKDVLSNLHWVLDHHKVRLDGLSKTNPAFRFLWGNKSPKDMNIEDIIAFAWVGEFIEFLTYYILFILYKDEKYDRILHEEFHHHNKLTPLWHKKIYWGVKVLITLLFLPFTQLRKNSGIKTDYR